MKYYIISWLIILLITCKAERSCEGCYDHPPVRTIPNALMARCSVYIYDESKVRRVYVETTTRDHPQTYRIFDSLVMDGRKLYDTVFRIDDYKYFDMSRFVIGDSFIYRTDVRWSREPAEFFNDTILFY